MIYLLKIEKKNGQRVEIPVSENRKTEFENFEELEKFRSEIQKQIGKEVYLTFKNK